MPIMMKYSIEVISYAITTYVFHSTLRTCLEFLTTNEIQASYGGKAAHSWQRWQLCAATATRRVEITVKVIVGNWHVLC